MSTRKTILILLAAASLAFAAGCAGEEDLCTGGECTAEPDPGDPLLDVPGPDTCTDQCANLRSCDFLDAETCALACESGAFSEAEMQCLARVSCSSHKILPCLEVDE